MHPIYLYIRKTAVSTYRIYSSLPLFLSLFSLGCIFFVEENETSTRSSALWLYVYCLYVFVLFFRHFFSINVPILLFAVRSFRFVFFLHFVVLLQFNKRHRHTNTSAAFFSVQSAKHPFMIALCAVKILYYTDTHSLSLAFYESNGSFTHFCFHLIQGFYHTLFHFHFSSCVLMFLRMSVCECVSCKCKKRHHNVTHCIRILLCVFILVIADFL